jgi:hypothetical protein
MSKIQIEGVSSLGLQNTNDDCEETLQPKHTREKIEENSENKFPQKRITTAHLSDQQRNRGRVGRKAHADDDGGLLAHEARSQRLELRMHRGSACDDRCGIRG